MLNSEVLDYFNSKKTNIRKTPTHNDLYFKILQGNKSPYRYANPSESIWSKCIRKHRPYTPIIKDVSICTSGWHLARGFEGLEHWLKFYSGNEKNDLLNVWIAEPHKNDLILPDNYDYGTYYPYNKVAFSRIKLIKKILTPPEIKEMWNTLFYPSSEKRQKYFKKYIYEKYKK